MTTPYNQTFRLTRRAILGTNTHCETPGECEAWLGADRKREFWVDADSFDVEICACYLLLDPLVLPPKCSAQERSQYMDKMMKRLARHRRRYETFFASKVKAMAKKKILRARK